MQTQQQAANGKIFSIDDDEDSNSNNKIGASDDEDSGDDGSELDDSEFGFEKDAKFPKRRSKDGEFINVDDSKR